MTDEGEISTTFRVRTKEDYRPSKKKDVLSRNSSLYSAHHSHSDASLEGEDRRPPKKSKIWQGRWDVKLTLNVRHLICMAVNDHTASSRQSAAR